MRPRLPSTDVKAAGYAEDHKEEFLGYEAFCNNAFGSPGNTAVALDRHFANLQGGVSEALSRHAIDIA